MTESLRDHADGSEPGPLARARQFVVSDMWHVDLRPRTLTASGVRLLQLGAMIARGFVQDELLLRASALTYVTTLSLMPLLIVTMSLIGLVGGAEDHRRFRGRPADGRQSRREGDHPLAARHGGHRRSRDRGR